MAAPGRARSAVGHGWSVAAAVLVFLLVLSLPATAWAQELPHLQAQVTDLTRAQVLAPGRAQVDAALADLLRKQDVQLWVLFVETTGNSTVTDYANQVARRNSLGGNDALLVVALGDRTDSIWRGSQSLQRLTDGEMETVLSRQVEPRLAQGDFPGAVVAATSGLAAVADAGDQTASGGPGLGTLVLPVALLGGGFWVWRSYAARRRGQQATAERAQQDEQLAQQANALLIHADEALRGAQEEIGFAEAQFGEADVGPYREAVATAAAELKAAFALRQQLDDAIPEDADTRRRMLEEMVAHAKAAQGGLDEQRQRLQQLRDLERTAPEVLAALPAQVDALEARIPEAERTIQGLDAYAERSWASVARNAAEARECVAQAREAAAQGQKSLAAGDRGAAVHAVRVAQQTMTEAKALLEAVDTLAAGLRAAEASAPAELQAASADVATAQHALAGVDDPALARRLADAGTALQQAERELDGTKPDYLAAVRLATQANATADAILAAVKQAEERRVQQGRLLEAQLRSAQASYDRAADFVAPRRRGIGTTVRTRLVEAERRLEHAKALAESDAGAAIEEAQRAQALADEAFALAQRDLERYDPYGGWTSFPRGGMGVPIPMPIPFPTGGWGGGFGGGGGGWGGGGGGGGGSGGGGAVGGHW
jgi:uncharacterized membrane protein YgcG